MDMVGLDGQPDDLPVVFIRYLLIDLLQTSMRWPDKHLAALLRTPDDVPHDKVDTLLLVLVFQAAIVSFFNNVCMSERPFIPWLKPRGFLAHCL
jgi:hypothetical protein